eukprot:871748-Prymnesium_polylepis.1
MEPPVELCDWLDWVSADTQTYFDALLGLYSTVVKGRNRTTSPAFQQLLPFDLLYAMTINERLQENHLNICARAAAIIRCLYVDNDIWDMHKIEAEQKLKSSPTKSLAAVALAAAAAAPCSAAVGVAAAPPLDPRKQKKRGLLALADAISTVKTEVDRFGTESPPDEYHNRMTRVNTVRIWKRAREDAATYALNARLVSQASGDRVHWKRFDMLKMFISDKYIGKAIKQASCLWSFSLSHSNTCTCHMSHDSQSKSY